MFSSIRFKKKSHYLLDSPILIWHVYHSEFFIFQLIEKMNKNTHKQNLSFFFLKNVWMVDVRTGWFKCPKYVNRVKFLSLSLGPILFVLILLLDNFSPFILDKISWQKKWTVVPYHMSSQLQNQQQQKTPKISIIWIKLSNLTLIGPKWIIWSFLIQLQLSKVWNILIDLCQVSPMPEDWRMTRLL